MAESTAPASAAHPVLPRSTPAAPAASPSSPKTAPGLLGTGQPAVTSLPPSRSVQIHQLVDVFFGAIGPGGIVSEKSAAKLKELADKVTDPKDKEHIQKMLDPVLRDLEFDDYESSVVRKEVDYLLDQLPDDNALKSQLVATRDVTFEDLTCHCKVPPRGVRVRAL